MQTFSALLAVGALGGSLVLLVGLTVGPGWTGELLEVVRGSAARLVLLLAGASMLGSLYFSEVANYAPCKLCWYQRICMYSIAIVSLTAVVRREPEARTKVLAPYVLVLSLIGLCVSTYHYVLEWFPQLESNVCSADVPCTTVWFRKLGFLTLPGMAWSAFAGVALVMTVVLVSSNDSTEDSAIEEGD